MLKPIKVWKVGDEEFATYAEANQAAILKRKMSVRDEIAYLISSKMNAGWKSREDDIDAAAGALLGKFTVTRRKPVFKIVTGIAK